MNGQQTVEQALTFCIQICMCLTTSHQRHAKSMNHYLITSTNPLKYEVIDAEQVEQQSTWILQNQVDQNEASSQRVKLEIQEQN